MEDNGPPTFGAVATPVCPTRQLKRAKATDDMSSAPSPLPVLSEIRQEDASVVIDLIYSDIKRASGTPLVNLIYRHLATIPGGLEWVWGCIRMNWGYDGLLRAAAAMPTAEVTITLPASLWRIAGLSDSDLTEIRSLVAQYNLTNAANIVGITALAHVARNPACCSNDVMLDWTGVPAAPLTPWANSGGVPRQRQKTIRAAERIAGELISNPRVGFPPPPQAAREATLRALDLFRTTLIAKMLPVGQILSQALKPA